MMNEQISPVHVDPYYQHEPPFAGNDERIFVCNQGHFLVGHFSADHFRRPFFGGAFFGAPFLGGIVLGGLAGSALFSPYLLWCAFWISVLLVKYILCKIESKKIVGLYFAAMEKKKTPKTVLR